MPNHTYTYALFAHIIGTDLEQYLPKNFGLPENSPFLEKSPPPTARPAPKPKLAKKDITKVILNLFYVVVDKVLIRSKNWAINIFLTVQAFLLNDRVQCTI